MATSTPNIEHRTSNTHDWRGQTSSANDGRTCQTTFVCAGCGAVTFWTSHTLWTSRCPSAGLTHVERHLTVPVKGAI